ncbi:MAG: hypothetical protein N0A00_03595 [Candidatus Bathyarchaeota archaeon]|nr:hypothetical protein [Candidatus Bathyarchaeota archaeon]
MTLTSRYCSMTASSLPTKDYEKIGLQKTEQAKEAMESMGISDDEVKMVIHNCEATGEKLHLPEEKRFLAKASVGERTVYVEYSPIEGSNAYKIHTAYAFRAKFKESKTGGVQTIKWHCFKCKEQMKSASVTMEYKGISGAVEGMRCPKCGNSYLTEDVVKAKVLKAEKLIDAKSR